MATRVKAVAALVAAMILVGSSVATGRVLVATLPIHFASLLRFALASLVLAPLVLVREGRLPRLSRRSLAIVFAQALCGSFLMGGAVYAAVSQDAAWALVCYDHTSHLFRLGDAITEVSRPKISVHSGTAFFFDGDYLYACAPDEVSAVSLTSGSVDALLSFAVG